MTERQKFIAFIKQQHPIGSVIEVSSCSQPYTVTNRTVFCAFPWTSEEYNDTFRPTDINDYLVSFTCHNPGRNTRDYVLRSYTRREINKILTF